MRILKRNIEILVSWMLVRFLDSCKDIKRSDAEDNKCL